MRINTVRILEPCASQRKPLPPLTSLVKLSNDAVYLAAPKSIYSSRRYRRAIRIIELCHMDANILLPHLLWPNNDEWLETFQSVLRPVTTLYVLADADGFVGRGVWTDVSHLFRHSHRARRLQSYAFTPNLSLTEHWCLTRWQGGADWLRYAALMAPMTRHRAVNLPKVVAALVPPALREGCCRG